MNEVKVLLHDLPCGIRGFVRKKNDDYTIVLNSRLSREQNKRTLKHELDHKEQHFEEGTDVQEIEYMLHAL